MKILYMCEICQNRYDIKEEALACESRTIPNYTIGLIYGDATGESHHDKDMTFCVAEYRTTRHYNISGSWACRDNGCGDSLGNELCGNGILHLTEYDAVKDFNHPTFKRMVAWLKSMDVQPFVWDGEKEVPYNG